MDDLKEVQHAVLGIMKDIDKGRILIRFALRIILSIGSMPAH